MSNHNKLQMKISESGLTFYITPHLMQKLGGDKSKMLIFAKKLDDGKYRVSVRESKQGSARIAANNTDSFPFKIDFRRSSNLPQPFDRFPHTPFRRPFMTTIEHDEQYPRQVHFTVSFKELTAGMEIDDRAPKVKPSADPKDFRGALAGLKEQMVVAKAAPSTQPQPQATPFRPAPEPLQIKAADIPQGEVRPAIRDQRTRFADALKEFNGSLCHDLDDIELYVERIDQDGKTVETITLPVPSQMRIKGRVIREETFG